MMQKGGNMTVNAPACVCVNKTSAPHSDTPAYCATELATVMSLKTTIRVADHYIFSSNDNK